MHSLTNQPRHGEHLLGGKHLCGNGNTMESKTRVPCPPDAFSLSDSHTVVQTELSALNGESVLLRKYIRTHFIKFGVRREFYLSYIL